ncbi:cytochrome c biogenesis CcdA family protein [Deinococcus caeni]|uniref:cytochrome c biogenesis CcdA family protein n=1 Tax=Deinococcus caeni TaxID=569127 RepID=UPI00361AAA57
MLVGVTLGVVWTPCVGPILASVTTLALSGQVTGFAFAATLAYALGVAAPMLTVMLGAAGCCTARRCRVAWEGCNRCSARCS